MPTVLLVIIVFAGAFFGAFFASALYISKREDKNKDG